MVLLIASLIIKHAFSTSLFVNKLATATLILGLGKNNSWSLEYLHLVITIPSFNAY